MCEVTPKREGFFRLGIGGSSEANKEQYPDVTPSEIKECNDFWKEIFILCRIFVHEHAREQGYEFIPTGKDKLKELRRISSE